MSQMTPERMRDLAERARDFDSSLANELEEFAGELEHFALLRRLAESVRARGDCGCSVALGDGTLATLSVNVPDPWAPSQPSSTEPKT